MPEIRPQFDPEALLVQYLAWDPDVVELAGEDVASTDLPRGWHPSPDVDPLRARVTLIGGTSDRRSSVSHLTSPRLQVDVYASSSGLAYEVAALIGSRIEVLPRSGFVFPGAVVTAATASTPRRNDDPSTDVPGYRLEVVLTGHPSAV